MTNYVARAGIHDLRIPAVGNDRDGDLTRFKESRRSHGRPFTRYERSGGIPDYHDGLLIHPDDKIDPHLRVISVNGKGQLHIRNDIALKISFCFNEKPCDFLTVSFIIRIINDSARDEIHGLSKYKMMIRHVVTNIKPCR